MEPIYSIIFRTEPRISLNGVEQSLNERQMFKNNSMGSEHAESKLSSPSYNLKMVTFFKSHLFSAKTK